MYFSQRKEAANYLYQLTKGNGASLSTAKCVEIRPSKYTFSSDDHNRNAFWNKRPIRMGEILHEILWLSASSKATSCCISLHCHTKSTGPFAEDRVAEWQSVVCAVFAYLGVHWFDHTSPGEFPGKRFDSPMKRQKSVALVNCFQILKQSVQCGRQMNNVRVCQ